MTTHDERGGMPREDADREQFAEGRGSDSSETKPKTGQHPGRQSHAGTFTDLSDTEREARKRDGESRRDDT